MKGGGKGAAGTLEQPPDDEVLDEPAGLMRILMLSRPEWGWLVVGSVLLLLSLAPTLALPLYFGWVVDAIQGPSSNSTDPCLRDHNEVGEFASDDRKSTVNDLVFQLVWILIGGSIASFFRGIVFNGGGERVVARLRIKLFEAIIQQEIGMFDKRKTGELISRLTSDCTSLQDVATSNVSMFFRGIVQIGVSAGLMFYTAWQLATMIMVVIPLCVGLVALYAPIVRRISTAYTDALGVSNDVAQESISNIRTVRSYAAEVVECQKYKNAIGDPDDKLDVQWCWFSRKPTAYKAGMQRQIASAFFMSFVTLLFMGVLVVVLWFGAHQVIDGNLSFGNLSSFILYAVQIAASIGMMAGLAASIAQAQGASTRTFQLIDRVPRVPTSGGVQPKAMDGVIAFENVTFSYPTRPDVLVMDNFSLDIPKDATVAFVGSSGAGKSTVLSLIQRFYDVTSGRIMLDGLPLTSLDPSWVRRQFAFVQQEPVLFGTTIAGNIGYGYNVKMNDILAKPTKEHVEGVAHDAFAHDFILGFPEGYETLVGERGVRLSGGQKQRVAIARALLMNPRVLLLDEATSALDAESEGIVTKAIERAMIGRTVVVVAHRLSTVRNADQIVVVDKGKLDSKGTHSELLKLSPKYQELVKRQLGGGVDEGGKGSPDAPHDDAAHKATGGKGVGVKALEMADLKAPLLDQHGFTAS